MPTFPSIRRFLAAATAAATLAFAASPARALEVAWVGARASTLGVGAELGVRVVPTIIVRGVVQGGSYGFDREIDGIDYAADLDLGSFGAQVDFHPPLMPLYVTAGIFSNDNTIAINARPTGAVNIGGTSYTAAEVGTLTGEAAFDSTALYGGLGFEFGLGPIAAVLEAGVYAQGEPSVSLRASGTAAANPDFQSALGREAASVADDLDYARHWPAVQLQARWRF
jgi:hypothetical protein